MKIKIFGDALVITSDLKKADIVTATKFFPEALTLKKAVDGEKPQAVYAMSLGQAGGFNKNGVIFDSADEEGFACVTICGQPSNLTQQEKANQFVENEARAIAYATELEEQIVMALAQHGDLIDRVSSAVEIIR